MTIENVKNKLTELKDNIIGLKGEFLSTLESMFNENEDLEYIKFNLYTPSFNDGEPCLPSFDEDSFVFCMSNSEKYSQYKAEFEDYDNDLYGDEESGKTDAPVTQIECKFVRDDTWRNYNTKLEDTFKSIKEFLNEQESTISEWFGSNITLIFHKNGKLETEDYYCGF